MLINRINIKAIGYLLGITLIIWGVMTLLPATVSFMFSESVYKIFLMSVALFITLGCTFSYLCRDYRLPFSKRDSQAAVGFIWFFIPFFASLPYMFFPEEFSLSDAIFESYSGFTTTGSTIIEDFKHIPEGLLIYRSMTQWIGGFGFSLMIILILKRFPGSLNNIFNAEFFSINNGKLYPHIRETVLRIFIIYFLLTACCMVLLCCSEMDWVTALCHAFSTISTGGFSTRSGNIGAFSVYVQNVIMCFMFLSGISYFLIIRIFKGRIKSIFADEQFRYYVLLILITSLCFALYWMKDYSGDFSQRIHSALFYAVSIISSTGYDLHSFNIGVFVSSALIILMFIGGCSASSSTGLKIIRVVLLLKYTRLALVKIFHPNAIVPVKYNKKAVSNDDIRRVFGFFFLYLFIFIAGIFLLVLFGNDLSLSMSMSAANLGNIGPVVGSYTSDFTYSMLNVPSQLTLISLMLIGRLEIFSFFILFSKSLWRRI